jgi:mRNA interferase YafQ
MYSVFRTNRFKKDYKKLSQGHKDILKEVVKKLSMGESLDDKYKDHKLIGNYLGCRECHLKPDLLLIYRIHQNILQLALVRVASHAELFKK